VVQIHVLHGQIVINEDAMNRAVSQIINIVRETVFEVLAFKSALVVRIII
jgi:UDP-N-acetylenolpyruvoylglucosamine reductase